MTKQEFWKIIDKVHRDSNGRMAVKCRLLRKALRKLSPSEIRSFDQNFGECEAKAYDWDVWAAARPGAAGASAVAAAIDGETRCVRPPAP